MVVHWWPDASSAQRPRTSAHISLLPMLLNFNSLSATQINVMKSQQSAVAVESFIAQLSCWTTSDIRLHFNGY